MFFKHFSLLLSLTAVTVVGSSMSAQAEVTNSAEGGTMSTEFFQSSESIAPSAKSESDMTPISPIDPIAVGAKETPTRQAKTTLDNADPAKFTSAGENQLATTTEVPDAEQVAQSTAMPAATATSHTPDDALNTQPVPDKIVTSAAALKTDLSTSPLPQIPSTTQAEITPQAQDSKIAQTDVIPGRATRSGSSYIGIAGNIGLGGNTALGEGSFAVISKIGLTRTLSARPAVLLNDNATFLIPITYDFSLQRGDDPLEPARFAPYLGAGISIGTSDQVNDDSDVGFLVTGGVDVPLTSQFTATGSINAAFKDETEVGLIIGVGYNFRGF